MVEPELPLLKTPAIARTPTATSTVAHPATTIPWVWRRLSVVRGGLGSPSADFFGAGASFFSGFGRRRRVEPRARGWRSSPGSLGSSASGATRRSFWARSVTSAEVLGVVLEVADGVGAVDRVGLPEQDSQ